MIADWSRWRIVPPDEDDGPYWPLSFMCPACHRVSYGVNDVRWAYCGTCHAITGHPANPDFTCAATCIKGVAVLYVWHADWLGVPHTMVDYFCAECGRILIRMSLHVE